MEFGRADGELHVGSRHFWVAVAARGEIGRLQSTELPDSRRRSSDCCGLHCRGIVPICGDWRTLPVWASSTWKIRGTPHRMADVGHEDHSTCCWGGLVCELSGTILAVCAWQAVGTGCVGSADRPPCHFELRRGEDGQDG